MEKGMTIHEALENKVSRVAHVVGARPQFIKLAPVATAFKELDIPFTVIHTGQHYDYAMSDVHFDALGLDGPEYHLEIGSASHARQTARMLEAIEEVLLAEKPAYVLVYGDTNSTLAGALAAVKLGMRVGHVEAGVRSYDRTMPEEINRIITDRVAEHHFCPTRGAVDLLAKEGIEGIFTGDVMYDALLKYSKLGVPQPYPRPFALATIHRAENTNDRSRFQNIWEGLSLIAKKMPVIFPAHPRTRNMYPDLVRSSGGLTVIEPVSYLAMLSMIRDASCMVTDSGGVQKEAFLLGCPCVTVRDVTEWPETVQAGGNRLVSPDPGLIVEAALDMAESAAFDAENPFGDGHASSRIARFIKERCF
jgi:UDP-N-acetylglucosamine 2-epimerase